MSSILNPSLIIHPCTCRLRPQSYNPWHLLYSCCPSQFMSDEHCCLHPQSWVQVPRWQSCCSEHQLVLTSLFIKYNCFIFFFFLQMETLRSRINHLLICKILDILLTGQIQPLQTTNRAISLWSTGEVHLRKKMSENELENGGTIPVNRSLPFSFPGLSAPW